MRKTPTPNFLAASLIAFSLLASNIAPAFAAPCKDAKGKFIKCPEKKLAPVKKGPCKDAKGKFIKCK